MAAGALINPPNIEKINLGRIIGRLQVKQENEDDDVVDTDIILFWGDEKRVITGSDILGRLLRGIAITESPRQP